MGDITRSVAAPTEVGSGWSLAFTSAGYLTQASHFYPKGERTSACKMRLRRARVPVNKGQVPGRVCKGCEEWIAEHPDGGRRNASTKG
jgi:hypothetical protein